MITEMTEFRKPKTLDIRLVKWGTPFAPLLPRSLRTAWAAELLPEWICDETGLAANTPPSNLGAHVWNTLTMTTMSPRLKHYLVHLVRTRRGAIGALRCFDQQWPVGLQIEDIAWNARTRNCLKKKGLLEHQKELAQLTFGDLFDIQGMGAMSVLDFCSTLEAVMDLYDQLASEFAEDIIGSGTAEFVTGLARTASKDWAAQVSEKDPRFASLLPPGHGTLQDRIERVLAEPDASGSLSVIPALVDSIIELERKISQLRDQTLEESLTEFLDVTMAGFTRCSTRRLETFAARLGWNGDKPATLRECAEQLGLTRERIRQIQKDIEAAIPDHEIFMPSLDSALVLLGETAPVSLAKATQTLLDSGISRVKFHLRSLLEAARLLGKQTSLRIISGPSGEMVVSDVDVEKAQVIPRMARKLVSRSGAASVYQVLDAVEAKGYEIDEEAVRGVLMGAATFKFFREDWFMATDIPPERNRLRNMTRRMLSVVSPQPIQSIREGLRRSYRGRAGSYSYPMTPIVPPLNVVEGVLRGIPDFDVYDGEVRSVIPLDYAKELGEVEQVLVEVLHASPAGVVDRRSLAEGCRARGMNENTFNLYSSYSCILEHVDLDVWKLRGVKVDPTAVEAVRASNQIRPRQKRVLGYGWTDDGKLWLAARIPRLGKESLVIGCPSAIQRYLAGQEFRCKGKGSSQDCGSVSVNERGASYGYGAFIRRIGIDENDVLLAEFDIASKVVTLSVGDEELLDEPG